MAVASRYLSQVTYRYMYNNIIVYDFFRRRPSPSRLIRCARDTFHNAPRESQRVSGRRDRCRGILNRRSYIYTYTPMHMRYGRRWVTADTALRCVYTRWQRTIVSRLPRTTLGKVVD